MVFFQLNVTGLLFQSFRTASPNNLPPSTRGWRVEGGKREKRHIEIGLTPYPMLCSPFRAYVVHSRYILYQCMQFLRFYAITAHDTPKAVPTAARIADARFHRNFIILVLFSLVISPQIFTD